MLESLFNKVAGQKVSNFTKNRLQHSCFPVNIAKFLIFKSSFFTEQIWWLLLLVAIVAIYVFVTSFLNTGQVIIFISIPPENVWKPGI